MFENIASFDIGASSVKLVIAKRRFKTFDIIKIDSEDIDLTEKHYFTALEETLHNLLNRNYIKNCRVLTALPMDRTIIRNLTFPFSDVEKIAGALPFEAEEHIPFKLEDVVLDFQILKTGNGEGANVLLAATHNEAVQEYLKVFNTLGIYPIYMGLETNALFSSYNQFTAVPDENVLLLDIGYNKTVMNIIISSSLSYTRCISVGMSEIIGYIANSLSMNKSKAHDKFRKLHIDLSSLDTNHSQSFFKSVGLTKMKLKKIYEETHEVYHDLIEQMHLTIKSFFLDNEKVPFTRIILTGGGAQLSGIGPMFSKAFGVPVSSLPLTGEVNHPENQHRYAIATGLILTYISSRKTTASFLKGDMVPEFARDEISKLYPAMIFSGMAVLIFILNIVISIVIQSSHNRKYNQELSNQFRTYFHIESKGDPLAEAKALLSSEKKDLTAFEVAIPSTSTVLYNLELLTKSFTADPAFTLKDITINDKLIQMNGESGESQKIDDFKNKLTQSGNYASVDLSTNISGNKAMRFTIVIKLKDESKGPKK